MKKKLTFIILLGLALVLTTGTFAYTYTNIGNTAIDAIMAEGPFATYQIAAQQPSWESIMPESESHADILVPIAAGDYTDILVQYPASGEHWDKVDEQPADDSGTYISTLGSSSWQGDAYQLSDFTGPGNSVINSVTVHVRFGGNASNYIARAIAELIINGNVYSGPTEQYSGTAFKDIAWQTDVNPDTSEPWTVEDVNALQAGVALKGPSNTRPSICTQVYIQVNYEYAAIVQGEVPQGALFDVLPHESFTGDMQVKIYLTNTAALMKAYQYLNMKVFTANTIEAGNEPNYQILSMENGLVTFNIIGGSATNYLVQVTGGSYRLISDDPDTWGEGWSITPEFYCEVTQR